MPIKRVAGVLPPDPYGYAFMHVHISRMTLCNAKKMIIQKIFRLIRREIPEIHLLLSRDLCLSIFEIENIANSLFHSFEI